MPSVAVVPAQFEIEWGAVSTVPARLTTAPLALRLTMGTVLAGTDIDINSQASVPNLNRLHAREHLHNPDGTPSHRFMAIWQEQATKTEEAFASLTGQVSDLETLVRRIEEAFNKAQAAQDAANDVRDKQDLADSYPDPASVVTFANDGTATVAAHHRKYPISGGRVSVDGGSVSGFTAGQYVTVYYNDPGKEGGAVTYLGTTEAIAQSDGRHIVGQGTIPSAGSPPAGGGGPTGPGYTPPPAGGSPNEYLP